ncbi:hypothetical protein EDC04DRAFT_2847809 [Pisolithus marmoratus]|nr:hypothetical protein EDC04DRAFT_2847809 [Pisolithus marmoratus]
MRMGWSHIFCLYAIMEIPTFVLAFDIVNWNLRSGVLFATTFFHTRISLLFPTARLRIIMVHMLLPHAFCS